jgi:hypothetical protein
MREKGGLERIVKMNRSPEKSSFEDLGGAVRGRVG